MVVALAGRRIDAADAKVRRFPLENSVLVRGRIAAHLKACGARDLVCSAACGADLLALEAAAEFGVDAHIYLPFARERFRVKSVTDRPGEWGDIFDRLTTDVELVVLGYEDGDPAAYSKTSTAMLDRAELLATEKGDSVLVLGVWDGTSRGERDETYGFMQAARARGLAVREIVTL